MKCSLNLFVPCNDKLQGVTSVAVNLRLDQGSCPITSHNVIVMAMCPAQKKLRFDYSSFLGSEIPLTIDEYVSDEVNATRQLLHELSVGQNEYFAVYISKLC